MIIEIQKGSKRVAYQQCLGRLQRQSGDLAQSQHEDLTAQLQRLCGSFTIKLQSTIAKDSGTILTLNGLRGTYATLALHSADVVIVEEHVLTHVCLDGQLQAIDEETL